MKINILFFGGLAIIFIFIQKEIRSQDPILDSLQQSIVHQKDDTNKVKNILLVSRKLGRINKQQALVYCDQAEKLSAELDYGKGIAGTWFERSIIYMKTSNIDTAILYNLKSIRINDSLQIFDQLAHNYNHMGTLMLRKNQTVEALDYYIKSKILFNSIADSLGLIYVYNSIGSLHRTQGIYDSAAYYFFNYIRLNEQVGNEAMVGIGMVNLANVYLLLEDYEKSKEYSLKSIDYNQKYDRPDCVVKAYKYLAIIYAKEKKYDESLHYFYLGTKLAEKISDLSELASLNINIGNMYEERMRFDSAFAYYEKAIQIAQSTGNMEVLANSLSNKGLIFERKGDYGNALILYDSVVKILEGSGNYYELSSVYYNIYKIYEIKNDYKNAFRYQSNYYTLKDSSVNIESRKAIADLTLRYEKEKDQAKILNLENKNLQQNLILRKKNNQKNIILFSAIGLLLIAFFLFIYIRQKNRKDKIIADQKIRQLEEEKKLLAASSIVNGQEEERKRIAKDLHDGLGVLLSTAKMQFSSIKDKSPENRPLIEKATQLLEQATGDVRRISHNMMPGLLTKFGFYEAVEDLLDQINEAGGPKTEIHIEGETSRLPQNFEIMLYRIVQEMVNNTLKYAEAKNISMIIKIGDDRLNIQFSDDGIGFNVQEKLDSNTIGISSIINRVEFLNGIVSIESKPGKGCIYLIQIPKS
jgi:signal transduction histidine kinase